MTNKPYIKGVDSLPHIHQFDNRRKRRDELFDRNRHKMGNHKGVKITVIGTYAYHRIAQRIGNKTIIHYIPKTK